LVHVLALATALCAAPAMAQQSPPSHTVQDGETLSQIALRYHVATASLAERNRLPAPYALRRGMRLRLPHNAVVPATPGAAAAPATTARVQPPAARPTARVQPPPTTTRASAAPRPAVQRRGSSRWGVPRTPGVVNLVRVCSDERATANLRRPGRNVLGLMRRFLRSTTGASHAIDPRLLRNLAVVSDHFGGRTVEVISGFRPFRRGQYTPHSNHNSGRAIDFRVVGVPRRTLVDFCRTLSGVGCGYYPRSVFTHMDVRGENAYWTDWSRPGERPRYGRDDRPPPERRPAVATSTPTPEPAPEPAPSGADGEMDDVADEAPAIRAANPADDGRDDGTAGAACPAPAPTVTP
jgi:uncharacterized protein YcbK (DUF882 family)